MPAWTRTGITKRTVTVVGPGTTTTRSDPEAMAEAAAADVQTNYLYVEKIEAGVTLYVFHRTGARADLMMTVGGTKATITSTGVHQVDYAMPLGAVTQTVVQASVTQSSTLEAIFALDDVYRTT